jgi:rare lipoprotein A
MRWLMMLGLGLAASLGGCTQIMVGSHLMKQMGSGSTCSAEGSLKVGNPYLVDGERYTPINSSYNFKEQGIASWYGSDFHGKATANGECYNMYAFTAAHKTLPLPSIVRVTNLENRKSVVLKVNDRGPFVAGRVIDLSYAAAQSLDVVGHGTAPVLVEAIGGPHHHPRGAAGLRGAAPMAMGRNDERAETLPTVVPSTLEEEELAPQTRDEQMTHAQAEAETKVERMLGVPDPDPSMPSPPPFEKRVFRDTTPLKKTLVYVQVGAFGDAVRAQEQQTALAKLYPTARLVPVTTPAGSLQRVQAGPFRSVADADEALRKVLEAGFAGARLQVEEK